MNNFKLKLASVFLTNLLALNIAMASDFKDVVRAQLQAREMTELSSGIAAKVIKLDFKEGQKFKKGDVLVGYDCELERAELEYAKTEVKAAEKNLQAIEKLNKLNATSILELENAKSRTLLAKSKQKIEQIKIAQCSEIAPFDGVVTKLNIHKYQRVKIGEPTMSIHSPFVLDVEMRVPSKWLVWLNVGSTFTMKVDETDAEITGSITRISGMVDAVSQTVTIYGEITNNNSLALPGMSGEISFTATN